jgi:hypothetical protein
MFHNKKNPPTLLVYFSYSEKNKGFMGSPTIIFWMHEPIFMKLGVNIMTSESISVAYFINLPSVCMCIPQLLQDNGSVCMFPQQHIRETRKNRTHRFLCNLCNIKGESGNLNTPIIARQWLSKHVPMATNIVGGVVFYAFYVVSKESRQFFAGLLFF